jgi:phage terminase small subunit
VVKRSTRARLSKLDINADRVLLELTRIAFFDPRRLFRSDGSLLPVQLWPAEVAAAICGIELGRTGLISKIRVCSKIAATELLGRFLRIWDGQVVQADRLNEIVEALRKVPADPEEEDKGRKKATVQ